MLLGESKFNSLSNIHLPKHGERLVTEYKEKSGGFVLLFFFLFLLWVFVCLFCFSFLNNEHSDVLEQVAQKGGGCLSLETFKANWSSEHLI